MESRDKKAQQSIVVRTENGAEWIGRGDWELPGPKSVLLEPAAPWAKQRKPALQY